MKKYWSLLPAGLIAVLAGCHISVRYDNPEKELSKVWMYQPGTIKEGKVDSLLSYTNFIELRPDGGFSSYLGKFATGSWSFDPKTQKLHLVKGWQSGIVCELRIIVRDLSKKAG